MQLSVIIPAFNAEDTISTQLEALSRQSWSQPWEVIVVDNGSTDGTRNVVEQYKNRLPDLRIVNAPKRRGAGHARNAGAKEVVGDALLFCDADDEVAPEWLAAMATALSEHDFVASRLDDEKLNDPDTLKVRRCPQKTGIQKYSYPPYLPHAASAGLGVKRSLHEAVGGFDESFYKLQDTDYCWQIQLAGTELHFVPDALVHMRLRNPTSAYRQARQWGMYNVKLYKKYRSRGMPKLTWRRSARRWLNMLRSLPQIWQREKRTGWLWHVNWAIGRLLGCIRYRVLAL